MRHSSDPNVVVITGASSGIGRATAHAFAKRGACVVLAARDAAGLEQAVRECEALGATAIAMVTDVRDQAAVLELARRAASLFGRIDVWVNNAAVTAIGPFEEIPADVYRAVIDTNLFGYVHGARAVLPYFREQGSGVLLNVASVVTDTPQPYTSAYNATKAAVRALAGSLRGELLLEGAKHIYVSTVVVPSVDTPLFQHAANYTRRKVRPIPPISNPERIARRLVRLSRRPKREAYLAPATRLLGIIQRLSPGTIERSMAKRVDRQHLADEPAQASTGNVFSPMQQLNQVHGGWRNRPALGRAATLSLLSLAMAALALTRAPLRRAGSLARGARLLAR